MSENNEYYRFKLFLTHFEFGDNDECWEWQGTTDSKDYGKFKWKDKGINYAHVASYVFFIGERGTKLVCHSCDNPPCVNPYHLFLGSYKQNTDDMIIKGRWRGGRPKRKRLRRHHTYRPDLHINVGENHGLAKLTWKKVYKIRRKYASGKYSYGKIARIYKVGVVTIFDVIKYRTWKE